MITLALILALGGLGYAYRAQIPAVLAWLKAEFASLFAKKAPAPAPAPTPAPVVAASASATATPPQAAPDTPIVAAVNAVAAVVAPAPVTPAHQGVIEKIEALLKKI